MTVDIGKTIRELREMRGMRQEDLALAVYGKKEYRTLVSRTERHSGDLTLEMLSAYAKALHVRVQDLLRGHPAAAFLTELLAVEGSDTVRPRISARRATPPRETLMEVATDVRRGFYRHYKGGIYFVHGVSRNDDTQEEVVVYESVQGCDVSPHRLRHRRLKEFDGYVVPTANLRHAKRFERVRSWT